MSDDRLDESAALENSPQDQVAAGDEPTTADDGEDTADKDLQPQYGVGPFSVREVALVGVWLVAFVISFFSVASQQAMAQLLFGGSVWTNGLDWILTIGVPTIAVFLVVLRRFSPDGIRRVGSLGVDQFASVAFSVSAVVWLTLLWRNVAVVLESRVWIYGWVVWLEFFLILIGVVLTVFAPVIPVLREDFDGRREVPAHRNARPIRAVTARPPREPRPAAAPAQTDGVDPANPYATGGFETTVIDTTSNDTTSNDYAPSGNESAEYDRSATASQDAWESTGPVDAYADVNAVASRQQAFWALAPQERDVVDDRGVPIFRVGPTAWALVLEDRGEVFVVRHEDGRVGYLHDVSDVTRG